MDMTGLASALGLFLKICLCLSTQLAEHGHGRTTAAGLGRTFFRSVNRDTHGYCRFRAELTIETRDDAARICEIGEFTVTAAETDPRARNTHATVRPIGTLQIS